LTALERQQLLIEWNNTQAHYPSDKCIHELFEAQVEKSPNAVAVIFEDEQLTYGELNLKANQLSHYLIGEKYVKPDSLVGICVERSMEMVIGILAILKAGGAYVPLDPEYPGARIKYMLEDAKLTTVLTQTHLRKTTPVSDIQAVCLDDIALQKELDSQSSHNPEQRKNAERPLAPDHLAYVIYTSGSTGNPKGVMIAHKNLVNLATAIKTIYQLSAEDKFLQFATINFDMSVEDIFGSLISGSQLVLRSDSWLESPQAFWKKCETFGITVLDLPTAFWSELAIDTSHLVPPCLRHISIGGEAVNKTAIESWLRKNSPLPRLMNTYGPTECTVDSTYTYIGDAQISIGKPLPNYSVFILNQYGAACAIGVTGELHIGGAGVAQGYLNRPDLTGEKFISNPFYDKEKLNSSERLYKTGDLVCWLPDGTIGFVGRIDYQVKIRGFRVELGEIENTLSSHPAVKESIVIATDAAAGDKRLIAYVVTNAIDLSDESEAAVIACNDLTEHLRHHVSQALPDYMIPSAIVFLNSFPLTPNGKVDRKALPEPSINSFRLNYCAPRTEVECMICAVWQDVLGLDVISTKDNFFALGGNSLLAIRALSKVNENCKVALSIRSLFLDPTVSGVAKVIDTMKLNAKNLHSLAENELVEEGFL
jgi:amino acid adenylation domain-containing protein